MLSWEELVWCCSYTYVFRADCLGLVHLSGGTIPEANYVFLSLWSLITWSTSPRGGTFWNFPHPCYMSNGAVIFQVLCRKPSFLRFHEYSFFVIYKSLSLSRWLGDHSVSSSAIVLEPLVQGLCGRHNNRLRHPPANGSLCFDQLCLSVRISVCYIKKILWWGVGVVSKVILRATSSTSLCSHLESLQLTDQTSHSYVYLKLLLSSLFARAVYSSFADSWFWLPCWSSPNWLL